MPRTVTFLLDHDNGRVFFICKDWTPILLVLAQLVLVKPGMRLFSGALGLVDFPANSSFPQKLIGFLTPSFRCCVALTPHYHAPPSSRFVAPTSATGDCTPISSPPPSAVMTRFRAARVVLSLFLVNAFLGKLLLPDADRLSSNCGCQEKDL